MTRGLSELLPKVMVIEAQPYPGAEKAVATLPISASLPK